MDAADALPPPPRRAAVQAPGRSIDPAELSSRSVRAMAWRDRDDIALLVPRPALTPPTPAEIGAIADAAAANGISRLITGALAATERAPFLAAGFEVHDRLHLLSHDLADLPPAPTLEVGLRRARRADRDAALAVDARAFDPFWRLDWAGLRDAIAATSTARFRVATDPEVLGYAVTGRSGERGYVQRLAVEPTHRGRGVGTALVLDGLRWLRRRRVRSAVVNTQVGNAGALALYRRLGFVPEPGGLTVLTLAFEDAR